MRRRRPRRLALALLGVLALTGCTPRTPLGIELREHSRFRQQWKHYQKLEEFKALAIAGDVEGVYVSGFSYDMANIDEAVHAALALCEARRADRRITAPCRTLAVGNERLGESP